MIALQNGTNTLLDVLLGVLGALFGGVMNKPVSIGFIAAATLFCGCSGGGNDAKSACQSIGSKTNAANVGGSSTNTQAVGDGNLSTFATFNVQAGTGYIDSQGNQFAAGSNAGVFLTPPAGTSATDITVSTFTTSDNTNVETATGPTLTITRTASDPATEYASFKTTLPFSGVKLTVNTSGNGDYLVYEFCGSAEVH